MPTLRCDVCNTPYYLSIFSEEIVRDGLGNMRFTCRECREYNAEAENTAQRRRRGRPCLKCSKPIKSTKRCGLCRYCNTCCICDMFCSSCKKVHSKGWKICNTCHLCSIYCKCRKRPKFLANLASKEKQTPKLINTLSRSLALEIEIADWAGYNNIISQLPSQHKYEWQSSVYIAHDSSVTSGSELVISPQSGDNFVHGVIKASSILQRSNVTFDSTCGFHVHVNASDYNALAIKNVLWIWRAYHRSMQGRLYNADRANNPYCKETTDWLKDVFPLIEHINNPRVLRAIFTWICAVGSRYFGSMVGSSTAERHQTERALNIPKIIELLPTNTVVNGSIIPKQLLLNGIKYIATNQLSFPKDLILRDGISVVRNHYNPIRYSSVNLASLWYRGSLEFRIKEATCALDELLMWPLFCGWITEIAMNENFNTIRKVTEHKNLAEFVSHRTYQGRRWFPEAVETWVQTKLGVV